MHKNRQLQKPNPSAHTAWAQCSPRGHSRAVGRHLPEPRPQPSLSARPAGAERRGMRSLTAPFHLDKDFQGHVRSPAGSSPAPMKSQARSPGPRRCSHPRCLPDTGTTCHIPPPAQPSFPRRHPLCSRASNTSVPVLQGWERAVQWALWPPRLTLLN